MKDTDICEIINKDASTLYMLMKYTSDIKLEDYLSKKYYSSDSLQPELKYYLYFNMIVEIFPNLKKDIVTNHCSTSILETIGDFMIDQYTEVMLRKDLNVIRNDKLDLEYILREYIIKLSLDATRTRLLLYAIKNIFNNYYSCSQEIFNKNIESVLKVMSNNTINIANIKILYNIIMDVDNCNKIFLKYHCDYSYRSIIDDIALYNYKQLEEIYNGMKSDVNWISYAFHIISAEKMKLIRILLENNIDIKANDNGIIDIIIDTYEEKRKKEFV